MVTSIQKEADFVQLFIFKGTVTLGRGTEPDINCEGCVARTYEELIQLNKKTNNNKIAKHVASKYMKR